VQGNHYLPSVAQVAECSPYKQKHGDAVHTNKNTGMQSIQTKTRECSTYKQKHGNAVHINKNTGMQSIQTKTRGCSPHKQKHGNGVHTNKNTGMQSIQIKTRGHQRRLSDQDTVKVKPCTVLRTQPTACCLRHRLLD